MAECLAVIATVKYLNYHKVNKKISISANNREFVEYTLKETTPRKKEMQATIKHLWQILEPFEWDISYERKRKTKLQGGTVNKKFPQGLFPWLKLDKRKVNETIYIKLPKCPAVQNQLLASIRTAKIGSESITVPIVSENALIAWEIAVTQKE